MLAGGLKTQTSRHARHAAPEPVLRCSEALARCGTEAAPAVKMRSLGSQHAAALLTCIAGTPHPRLHRWHPSSAPASLAPLIRACIAGTPHPRLLVRGCAMRTADCA
eukprot:364741-Chlamydomonas_euryale.AAC.20